MKSHSPLRVVQKKFKALGTNITIHIIIVNIVDAEKAERDSAEAELYYHKAEKIFSRFDLQSELSVLNSNVGKHLSVSSEMKTVVQHALTYHQKTDGYFDPRIIEKLEQIGYDRDFKAIDVSNTSLHRTDKILNKKLAEDLILGVQSVCFGSRMDFAGIVKGWVTDEVAHFLEQRGWKNFLVDSGGDMHSKGIDKTGKPWYVDIEGIPHEHMMLELSGQGIATSGITRRKWQRGKERVHHLINPKDPFRFSFDLKSVTVIAERTEEADVLAKAVFLMGVHLGKRYVEENAIACVILDRKGNAWVSRAVQKFMYKGDI